MSGPEDKFRSAGARIEFPPQPPMPPNGDAGTGSSKRNGFSKLRDRSIMRYDPDCISDLATQAEGKLIAAGADVFQRAGHLLRPGYDEVEASDDRITIAPGLYEVSEAALLDELARTTRWQKYDERSKKQKAIPPPSVVVKLLASRAGQWRFRSVIGVVTCPTMRRDGSILSTPGYDRVTRLYYMPDQRFALPPIGTTKAEAEEALALLQTLLAEFPFVNEASRAVALSLIITAVTRGAYKV